MIRETKPRKAKYGFEIQMSHDMLNYAPAFAAVAAELAAVPVKNKESQASYWTEYKNGAGTYALTIYVNDPLLAIKLREAMLVKQTVAPKESITAEFEIGETVTIHNPGNTYDTYSAWPEIDSVPHFEYGNVPERGRIGTITHIGRHEFLDGTDPVLYVVDGRFIVGPRAFKPKGT